MSRPSQRKAARSKRRKERKRKKEQKRDQQRASSGGASSFWVLRVAGTDLGFTIPYTPTLEDLGEAAHTFAFSTLRGAKEVCAEVNKDAAVDPDTGEFVRIEPLQLRREFFLEEVLPTMINGGADLLTLDEEVLPLTELGVQHFTHAWKNRYWEQMLDRGDLHAVVSVIAYSTTPEGDPYLGWGPTAKGRKLLEEFRNARLGFNLSRALGVNFVSSVDPASVRAHASQQSHDVSVGTPLPAPGERFIVKVQLPLDGEEGTHPLLVYNENRSIQRFEYEADFAEGVLGLFGPSQIKGFLYAELSEEGDISYQMEGLAPWQDW